MRIQSSCHESAQSVPPNPWKFQRVTERRSVPFRRFRDSRDAVEDCRAMAARRKMAQLSGTPLACRFRRVQRGHFNRSHYREVRRVLVNARAERANDGVRDGIELVGLVGRL